MQREPSPELDVFIAGQILEVASSKRGSTWLHHPPSIRGFFHFLHFVGLDRHGEP